MWVEQGQNVPNPMDLGYIVLKEPSAEFSEIHSGWNQSLEKIERPMNYRPVFKQVRNTYDIIFYTNLPEPIEKRYSIPYGETVEDIEEEKKKYYIGGKEDNISQLHIFDKWISNTPGVIDRLITPLKYQTEPIELHASFIFTGDKNDIPWSHIARLAAAGNQQITFIDPENNKEVTVEPFGIGSTKDIFITRNGLEHTITMELIDIKYDKLLEPSSEYNNNSSFATFTFLAKQIPWKQVFNSSAKTFIHPENGIAYTGYTAGGWEASDIRKWSNENLLVLLKEKNNGLNEAIKEVEKISDIGMPEVVSNFKDENGQTVAFKQMVNITYDKIWLPSTTELGVSDNSFTWNTTDEQSTKIEYDSEGHLVYVPYTWISTDETRIKKLNDIPDYYYTRTHKPDYTWRFIRISPAGLVDYNVTATESSGYVFGFCI
jgi:hypothetical protein